MSSTESQFLMSMEKEQYKGKWVAILDSEVIAKGGDLSTVYKEAIEKSNGRTPLFEYISEKTDKEETLIL